MDNAAKDNKNVVMFAYLSLLVKCKWFRQIYVHFLPPGHTHSNLDQKYSVISQTLKNKDVLSLPQLMGDVAGLFKNMGDYTGQHVVEAVGDYTTYFKGRMHSLYGHGTSTVNGVNRRLHAFKICTSPSGQVGAYFEHLRLQL
jgi:hypothetical protein